MGDINLLAKALKGLKELVLHRGKQNFGQVTVRDDSFQVWEVSIRKTGDRGRYLRFELVGESSKSFRASADGYKPEEYLPITVTEWNVFAAVAANQTDQEAQERAREIMNKLVAKERKTVDLVYFRGREA